MASMHILITSQEDLLILSDLQRAISMSLFFTVSQLVEPFSAANIMTVC